MTHSHTIFHTQYCDIAISRYSDKKYFFNQYFSSCVNSAIDAYNLKILWNVTTIFWWKNYLFIALSFYRNMFLWQYLFIAILCVKMSHVNKALEKFAFEFNQYCYPILSISLVVAVRLLLPTLIGSLTFTTLSRFLRHPKMVK